MSLPTCPDDRALRRHIHSIPPQYSKFGLEGFTEAVAKEMHPDWNIHFMIVEPGGMKTEFSGSGFVQGARHPAYLDPSGPYNQLAAYMADPKSRDGWADPAVVARVTVDTIARKGKERCRLDCRWGVTRGV